MYSNKESNSVGGMFIAFILLVFMLVFAIGTSENEYKERTTQGETFTAEPYTGDSMGEWFEYVYNE